MPAQAIGGDANPKEKPRPDRAYRETVSRPQPAPDAAASAFQRIRAMSDHAR